MGALSVVVAAESAPVADSAEEESAAEAAAGALAPAVARDLDALWPAAEAARAAVRPSQGRY